MRIWFGCRLKVDWANGKGPSGLGLVFASSGVWYVAGEWRGCRAGFAAAGLSSHNQPPRDIRERVRDLLKDKYADFGPKLASEKLLELDGIVFSRETIRRIQMDTGSWKPKKRRARRVFQPRDRRPGSAS